MCVLKKFLGIVLAMAMMISALSPVLLQVNAAEVAPVYILDAEDLDGRDFTDSVTLAQLLNKVFAGDIDIFSDSGYKNEVFMELGYNMSMTTQYYVKSKTSNNTVSGWQCYIYANAVYNKLFGEWVKHAKSFAHSTVVIPGGSSSLSYELLRSKGVRCGAYLRTTNKSNGEYNGDAGHSLIILDYDETTITYLEGNGDGKGLVRVVVRTWENFNYFNFERKNRYISHLVQPTNSYYSTHFPNCSHPSYEGCGVCSACGYTYDWQSTLDPWAQGIYRLTEKVIPRSGAPYSAAAKANVTLEKNQQIRTTGQYRNALDQIWYSAKDASGNTFYLNGASLKFVEYPELEVTCTGFSPADGAQLEQKSNPVIGTVTSNFPLKSITGYLDGEPYATWTTPSDTTTTQVNLRQTVINEKLSFSKLEAGKHRIKLVARSYVHSHDVVIHESIFYIKTSQPCTHEYVQSLTVDATCTDSGVLTYTCKKCDDSYIRVIAPYGHEYRNGSCVHCSSPEFIASLSGNVASSGKVDDPVTVTLSQNGQVIYEVIADSNTYTLADIQPGTYTVTVSKNQCTPRTVELTLESGDLVYDFKICNPGDVNADHRLNIGDISKLYAHVRGSNKLQDQYAQLCADYNADGSVNIGDTVRLYSRVTKK